MHTLGLTTQQPGIATGISDALLAGGFGYNKVVNTQTFANTVGAPVLFTISGDVIVRIVAVCKVVCASAGACNASVGIAASTAHIIALTNITLLAAMEIWHDNAPANEIEALTVIKDRIITDGNDILLTLSAQADSGQIAFYCFWTPLSVGATVA